MTEVLPKGRDFAKLAKLPELRNDVSPPAIFARKLVLSFLRWFFGNRTDGDYLYHPDPNVTQIQIHDCFVDAKPELARSPQVIVGRDTVASYPAAGNMVAVPAKGANLFSNIEIIPIWIEVRSRSYLEAELLACTIRSAIRIWKEFLLAHCHAIFNESLSPVQSGSQEGVPPYYACVTTFQLAIVDQWLARNPNLKDTLAREEEGEPITGYNIPPHDFNDIKVEEE